MGLGSWCCYIAKKQPLLISEVNSLYKLSIDSDLKIVSMVEKKECIIPNNTLNKKNQTRRPLLIALGLVDC